MTPPPNRLHRPGQHRRLWRYELTALALVGLALAALAWPAAVARADLPRAPQTLLTDDLVSYWPLEEATGTREDAHGTNDVVADTDRPSTDGIVGDALHYTDLHGNPAQREYYIADNASLDLSGAGFTVSGWSNPDSATHTGFNGVIISKTGVIAGVEWMLYSNETLGKFEFLVSSNGTTSTTVTAATTYTASQWNHVVAWLDLDADTINIQTNGGSVVSAAFTGDVFNGTERLTIAGTANNNFVNVAGPLDEIGIWERPLTELERDVLWNNGEGCTYPFEDCPGSGVSNVWRIGNYIQDESMETATLFDNTFFSPWDSDPAFSQSNQSEWTDTGPGPVCDSRFRELLALINAPLVVGDPATTYLPYIPPEVRSQVNQTFLWYGGRMFISFAYLTTEDGELRADLTGPFGEHIPLVEGLSNDSDEWEAWYGFTDDLILGRYTLAISVSGGDGSPAERAAIDAVSVSEGDYQHCDYEETVNNAPPDPGIHNLRSQTFVGSEGNLIDNSEFEELGGEVTNWFLPTRGAALVETEQAGPNSGYVAMFTGAPAVMTKPWIQSLYELPVADSRGWILGEAFGLVGRQLSFSFMVADVGEHIAHEVMKIENVDTGEVIDFSNVHSYTPVPGTTWAKVELQTLNLPPARYRLQFRNPYPWQVGAVERTIYLDKVCVGAIQFIVAPECDFNGAEILQLLNDINFANEQAASAQATAIAGATATVFYQAVGTQVAAAATSYTNNQHATQTQLVAAGNLTAISAATRTQVRALTQTPVAALTSTAFVQNFHATMTAQSAGTATRAVQIIGTLTQLAQNRGTATANAATQAGYQATLFSQQTAAAQLTNQAMGQATLVVVATSQVNTNATIQPLVTSYAATQYAAQTALAAGSNATTQFQATQAAAIVATANSLATQQVGIQQTQQSQLTAAPGQQLTLAAAATQIAEQYATLLPTLQAVATQQVLQMPPSQPAPDTVEVGCDRPTNPLNLAWWIDYEVCRVLWFFTPNASNLAQVQQVSTQVVGFEPWGTLFEVNAAQDELREEVEKYNWYETGQDGAQDNITIIEHDLATPIPGGPVLIPMATTVPILMGDVNFGDPGLNYVFSINCALRLEQNIGPYLTPPICFLIDITRQTGLLPLARIIFDIGAIVILVRWASRAMADFAGDPNNQGPSTSK